MAHPSNPMSITLKDAPEMEYTRLGTTGLKVSRICLGMMSFGSKSWQPWVLEEDQAMPIIKAAYNRGVNFWDTANIYSLGKSEEITGKAWRAFAPSREHVVIATKLYSPLEVGKNTPFGRVVDFSAGGHVNNQGLSRKHIMASVEASLKRLQTDYIDLYQIHRFDYDTPLSETMLALHDLVRAGKVRYIGASSMYAWQFAKAQEIARTNGWTPFSSMQNFYNLVYREEEREMIPLCLDQGVGLMPWSPLARGFLTGRQKSLRSETDRFSKAFQHPNDNAILERVKEVASQLKVTPAQVCISQWLH